MSWTVILEDENQNPIETLDQEFVLNEISETLINKEFKLVKYLDPYGNTIFNRQQIDDLISDLEKIYSGSSDIAIPGLIELAIRCKSEVHSYLVFYGD
jgi:lipopolysaccharide biosynthesis glycosyltransferase